MARVNFAVLLLLGLCFAGLFLIGVIDSAMTNTEFLDYGGNWNVRLSGKRVLFELTKAQAIEGIAVNDPVDYSVQFLGFNASLSRYNVGGGFGVRGNPTTLSEVLFAICIPIWQVVTVHVLVIAVLCYRRCRRIGDREKKSLSCACCGYSLLGNESGMCSECGTPISDGQKQAIAKATANSGRRPTPDHRL